MMQQASNAPPRGRPKANSLGVGTMIQMNLYVGHVAIHFWQGDSHFAYRNTGPSPNFFVSTTAASN